MSLLSLDTARFHLRPLAARDAALYVALYTDPAVMRHVVEPLDAAVARQAFSKVESFSRNGSRDYRTWVVVEKASDREIGLLALVAREGMHEIGALIWPEWHNGGVATEIIRRLMDFAFSEDGCQIVFTRHQAENGGAEGLMRKLDFERTPAEGHRDGGVRWERTRARWQHASGNAMKQGKT
ncbi:GNAT family N-acetyltransferase [Pseudoxanthomonas sp. PXM02]|uniref:GNAT family N-acetyltransferase n=1 Tax=Pseudoxanthomonas sp. PXM02 TaxID=2769294 RepID=UPI00177F41DD|nr:GNAT family N-acetyltransferase [Pseudoxanthomonas sp. PXM02]MBD9477639.1 GNAT family N-acetyltransferase [Pseudoxanthomonas sp. PXM02]